MPTQTIVYTNNYLSCRPWRGAFIEKYIDYKQLMYSIRPIGDGTRMTFVYVTRYYISI